MIKKLLALALLGAMSLTSLGAMKRNNGAMPLCKKRLKFGDDSSTQPASLTDLAPVQSLVTAGTTAAVSSTSSVSTSTTNVSNTSTTNHTVTSMHDTDNDAPASSGQSSSSSTLISTAPKLLGEKRPDVVQAAIDKIFEIVTKKVTPLTWGFNGQHGAYGLFGLKDEMVLQSLASKDAQDIYILDVGCARGTWGAFAMNVLANDKECQKSGKRFHIISITGGNEISTNEVERKGNVTHYRFKQFKIENIEEELLKKGFNLKEKVHLMVSHWTMRHLVDPFGTLVRMYRLLSPDGGMLLSNGFFFTFADNEEVQTFPTKNWNLLAYSNAITLFRQVAKTPDQSLDEETGEFVLMKTDHQELTIPLTYVNVQMLPSSSSYHFYSHMLTVFKKNDVEQAEALCLNSQSKHPIYCDKKNKTSEQLYTWLKNNKFFLGD